MKLKVNPQIARIHAHICGDGSVYIKNIRRGEKELKKHKRKNPYKKEYTIEYYNNDKNLVEEFVNDFKISFNRNKKTIKNKVKFRAVKHIIKDLELTGKNSYNWHIPHFIFAASNKVIGNWLRAFFDDEAYIHPSRKRILTKSMNNKGLIQVGKLLKKFGITGKITGPNCDNSYYLVIYEKDLYKYKKKIGFLMKRKFELLKDIIKKRKKWGRRNFHSAKKNFLAGI